MKVDELIEEVERNSEFLKKVVGKVVGVLDGVSYMDVLLVLMFARISILYRVMSECYGMFDPEECGKEVMDFLNSYQELERRLVAAVVDTPKSYYRVLEKLGLIKGE